MAPSLCLDLGTQQPKRSYEDGKVKLTFPIHFTLALKI